MFVPPVSFFAASRSVLRFRCRVHKPDLGASPDFCRGFGFLARALFTVVGFPSPWIFLSQSRFPALARAVSWFGADPAQIFPLVFVPWPASHSALPGLLISPARGSRFVAGSMPRPGIFDLFFCHSVPACLCPVIDSVHQGAHFPARRFHAADLFFSALFPSVIIPRSSSVLDSLSGFQLQPSQLPPVRVSWPPWVSLVRSREHAVFYVNFSLRSPAVETVSFCAHCVQISLLMFLRVTPVAFTVQKLSSS